MVYTAPPNLPTMKILYAYHKEVEYKHRGKKGLGSGAERDKIML